MTDDALTLHLPPAQLLDPRPALERWLRRFAGAHLRERTAVLGERIGLADDDPRINPLGGAIALVGTGFLLGVL